MLIQKFINVFVDKDTLTSLGIVSNNSSGLKEYIFRTIANTYFINGSYAVYEID